MKPHSADFKVVNPRTVKDIVQILDTEENALPLAGGTDLYVSLRQDQLDPCVFVNLDACEELSGKPELKEDKLVLDALTTFKDVRYDKKIEEKYPLLTKGAELVSTLGIQSRATWAGNIANASPCANGTAGLMAYDAELELAGPDGSRRVQLDKFYSDYKEMDMASNEFIHKIHIPRPGPGWSGYYRDVGSRNYQAVSKTLLVGRRRTGENNRVEDVRIICGSVAPYTLRAENTEESLRGKILAPDLITDALETLKEEIAPIDDIRSNRKYRRQVTLNMLKEFLGEQLPV